MTFFHAIRRRHQINRAVRELSRLDNDILKDIGVDPANITNMVENMIDARAAQREKKRPDAGYAAASYTAAGGAAA